MTLGLQWLSVLFLAGSALLFTVWRSKFMLVSRYFCDPVDGGAPPGECYWYTKPWSRAQVGLHLHLWSVFPGGVLAILQFIPSIRCLFPHIHRSLGYICWSLGLVAAISSLLISDHAFGGAISTQASCMVLSSIVAVGTLKAYLSIKALRLDEHRAWMIRIWVNMGSILTMRMFLVPIAILISLLQRIGAPGANYYGMVELSCEQLFYVFHSGKQFKGMVNKANFFDIYGTSCLSNLAVLNNPSALPKASAISLTDAYNSFTPGAKVCVAADILARRRDLTVAALDVAFGPAFALAILLHIVLVERYLRNDTTEADRLRKLGELKRRAREKELEIGEINDTLDDYKTQNGSQEKRSGNSGTKGLRVEVREVQEQTAAILSGH